MSAPIKTGHLETIQSTLHIHFTGVRYGEFVKRQHDLSIALPTVMFDAPDTSLAQYVLLVLSGGKMYQEVDNLRIDEDAIASETSIRVDPN